MHCIIAVRIFIIIILDVCLHKIKQWSRNNNRKLVYSKKRLRHKLSRKPSSLVYSLFPNDNYLTFSLISVKTDLENKVIGFEFVPERSISNHKGFFQDSSDEGDAMERDMFDRKDCNPSVWWKCRNCSTMKTEKECLCCQVVEAVRNFILQATFALSQAIIWSELHKQSHGL